MSSETTESLIVARCGLVCSHCGAFCRGKCAGCHSDKPMFACCPVKACCTETGLSTCAECGAYPDLRRCRKLHNPVSRLFRLVFRTDRIGNLHRIREIGLDAFKSERLATGRK